MKKINWNKAIIISLYFGIFQALMPIIGYYLGTTFEDIVTNVDHWIAFILLSFIGGNMIRESFSKDVENTNDKIDFKTMLVLSIATSIDALAVGITFAFFYINIFNTVLFIGIITTVISLIGVIIGNKVGNKFESKAEIIGGIILIFIGFKILLNHIGII